jgi:hypothetical protein
VAVGHIRYEILAQEALRGVVRTVLRDTARDGLPGEHHFYITFDTRAEGVRLSARMLAQYPEEMTVVLQHQFWDLVVTDEYFEVGVSFGGIPERLVVPFTAMKGFFDPSVQFGVQFERIAEPAGDSSQERASASEKPGAGRQPAEQKRASPVLAPVPAPTNSADASGPAEAEGKAPAGGGEVVRLDRFRKK